MRVNIQQIIILLMVTVHIAFSGIVITVITEEHGRGPVAKSVEKIYLENNMLRADATGDDENWGMIYRKDKDVVWIIDHRKKEYSEMTREQLQQIAKKTKSAMEEMMKQMEAQMQNLPPEQRQMMEEMMKENMPSASAPGSEVKTVYKKVESGVKVGQWSCIHYVGYKDGEKKEEVWAVPMSELGITESDFAIFKELGSFFGELPGESEGLFRGFSKEEQGFEGFPIKEIMYSDGKVESVNLVEKISKEKIDPEIFNLPAGYKKTSTTFPGMGGGEGMEY